MTSILNEYCQQQGLNNPVWNMTMSGAPHKPSITLSTTMFGKVFSAQSTNKKEAKQLCAQQIIDHFHIQSKPKKTTISIDMDKSVDELWDDFKFLTITMTKKEEVKKIHFQSMTPNNP